MYHIGLPNPMNVVKSIPHRLGIGGGDPPQPNLADNVVTRRLITMLTLGALNASHPAKNREQYGELLHNLDPRTPKGLISLASLVFAPRFDAEGALNPNELGPVNPQTGLHVPLPRVNVQRTGNPHRDMHLDAENTLLRALRLRREVSKPVVQREGSRMVERIRNPATLENAHTMLENSETLHGGGPHLAMHTAMGPSKRALLLKLLANERVT